jgi:hypothetical protein
MVIKICENGLKKILRLIFIIFEVIKQQKLMLLTYLRN